MGNHPAAAAAALRSAALLVAADALISTIRQKTAKITARVDIMTDLHPLPNPHTRRTSDKKNRADVLRSVLPRQQLAALAHPHGEVPAAGDESTRPRKEKVFPVQPTKLYFNFAPTELTLRKKSSV